MPIAAKEIFVKDLLDSKFLFQVPYYQRPYAWTRENCDQLFEDLRSSLQQKDQETYFLGSIVLQTLVEEADGSGRFDLVDGQQRITTLIVLLAVLRDLAHEVGNLKAAESIQKKIYQQADDYTGTPEDIRLTVWEHEQEFFKQYIFTERGTSQLKDAKRETEAQDRICEAVALFGNKLRNAQGEVDRRLLDEVAKFVLSKSMFVYIKADGLSSAFRLFSVLNTRGLSLKISDLLKSDSLAEVANGEGKKFARMWEEMEEELGRENLESLIAHIRTIHVKDKTRKTMWDEYQENVFKPKLLKKGVEFISYLREMASLFADKVLSPAANTDQEVDTKYFNLVSLMRDEIPSSDWIPPLLSFSRKFGDEEKRYEFLKQLERRFVVDRVLGLTPTQRETRTFEILRAIDAAADADAVISHASLVTTGDKGAFLAEIGEAQFYERSDSRYILLRMDLELYDNQTVLRRYAGQVTIEHILPRTPPDGSEWMKAFTSQERAEWTHRIGNLILLSRKKNSSANNKAFKEKLGSYYERGVTDFALTQQVKGLTEWTLPLLQKRQAEMLELASRIWVE